MPALGVESWRRSLREGHGWKDLSERHRVGVLFQGACVLAHLEKLGMCLGEGLWSRAHVDAEGRLRGLSARVGSSRRRPQQELSELATCLFGDESKLRGRGQARRLVRELVAEWRQTLADVELGDVVEDVLRRANYLGSHPYRVHRGALAAEVQSDGRTSVQLLGRPRLALRTCSSAAAARRLIESPDFDRLWSRSPGSPRSRSDAHDAGHSRVPTLIRAGSSPESIELSSPGSRVHRARDLLRLGRAESALALLRSSATLDERILRVSCLVQLGRLRAAQRGITQLERMNLEGDQLVEVGDAALRVLANRAQKDRLASWISRLELADTENLDRETVARCRVVAALGRWDLGQVDEMESDLERAVDIYPGVAERAELHHARALLDLKRGRPKRAVQAIGKALRRCRRHMDRYRAGRLWNDMVLATVAAEDLAGAERACRHAHRLLAACEGPGSETLTLHNLAEIRIRRGRFEGTTDLLDRVSERNRRDDNLRGWIEDQELRARLELGRGDFGAALKRLHETSDVLDSKGIEWHRTHLRVLEARAQGQLGRREIAARLLEDVGSFPEGLLEPEERVVLLAQAGLDDRWEREARTSESASRVASLLRTRQISWAQLARLELEAFRVARLAFDIHVWAPESLEPPARRHAARELRSGGAERLAERLEATLRDPWSATEEFLAGPSSFERVRALLISVGCGDLRLLRRPHAGEELVVADGVGGPGHFELELAAATWTARADVIDSQTRSLVRLIAERHERPSTAPAQPRRRALSQPALPEGVIGDCSRLVSFYDELSTLAMGRLPILILGETGTGKERAARTVHDRSGRSGPYLAVNCAALTETLLMSELFGHARGAFTGADQDRTGVFETARGGTVFLDEIGDLAASAQGMLLRVLQEGEIRRVGDSRPRSVDVRIVAATHRDLGALVSSGDFREDLFYRLGVAICELPPLRERGDDVVLLAEHFLAEAASDISFSDEARLALSSQSWPGNIRQLKAVVDRAAVLSTGCVDVCDLNLPAGSSKEGWHDWLDRLKRERLESVLVGCGRNQAEAARRLGLTRQALSYLVKQYGL